MQLTVPCPFQRWKRSVALRKGEGGQTDRQRSSVLAALPSLECWPAGSQEGQGRPFIEPTMCLRASHHHYTPTPISQASKGRHREEAVC